MHNLKKQHSKTNAPNTKDYLWYILVCLGYYNKIPEPGWLIIRINLFLSLLEAEQFKISVPEGSGSELLTADFLSPHLVEGVTEFSGASFTRALISFMKVKPPDNSSSHLIDLFACLFCLAFSPPPKSVLQCVPRLAAFFRTHGNKVWEISLNWCKEFSSVQFSRSVMSNSLWPHGLQHSRLPCPLPASGTCSNSCPLCWWCHPTTSSSLVPFSSCPQSFPASGSSPMSQLFASGGQSIGVSASASVLPMNIQDWFPLELTGLISLLSKGLSQVFSNTTEDIKKRWQEYTEELYKKDLNNPDNHSGMITHL